ncbi:MAG: cytochrome C oxidase subunit IV family protein [Flavobacteriales bacterium]
MDARDDIYEYSLDTHHSEEEGKKMRKKFYFVLALLSIVTIIEVGMGMIWSRDESMKEILKYTFIILTLVKAGYITMIFMHLGDEKKSFQAVVLLPYFILIGYLIFICLVEALYAGELRPLIENYLGF